ncbi:MULTISPECIES: glycosyltransferase [Caballeronia]|uniref:glycosyltransferase n=1 Tax=Caballeronia TaxID=1827195 RepID=UPI00045EE6ED|nr:MULTISPECIES: glycosyltransferase [unclassified Caballeronia]AQH02091.1 glycosyl transferase [Burkholderia sp. KK1]BAO89449.1 glycosyl transferase [Burkholderia sp. RPE67]BBP97953.1 glycosyl transferase [Burkholderia sp. SFA1]MCE4545169.1 glycosyltransferase [Caballeronia sp. PC1]MCE4570594.1 glycosyltransferase [Caballeronia sp. CLC5]
MKEIVHITEAFGGGVLSMLTQLSNRAAAAGVGVTILHSIRQETPNDFSKLFHPAVKLTYVNMVREVSVKHDLSGLRDLVRKLRECDPSVIHLHSSKAGVLGRAAARIAAPRARVFYSPHGLAFLRRDVSAAKQFAYLSFERIAARLGGTIVACSKSELAEIETKMHARQARMIENGVNVTEIPPRIEKRDGELVIGMSGRAMFQKNHEAFVKLATALHGPSVRFVWIGGSEDELPAGTPKGAVSCSGWVTRERALELTSELDIYVQTSRWEGMPIALIEAQVAGIPAVVTDVVGNRDVVQHGLTGFVASSAEEMEKCIAILRDEPALRARMGAAARASASKRFSMDAIFRQWLLMYQFGSDKPARELGANQAASYETSSDSQF